MKSLVLAFAFSAFAETEQVGANPIRKVVNMLQAMQKKIEEEADKEKELYEKFQCYCKSNTGELTKSIAEAQTKIAQLETQVKEDTAAKEQTDEELKNHKQDREEAKASLSAATKQRNKEAEIYAKESGDTGTNVDALNKAIEALEQGLRGGAFMQTQAGARLKQLVLTNRQLSDLDRESVTGFLSGSSSAPGSSEIVGILKEMKDEMNRDLGGLVEEEEQAKTAFQQLTAAKKKEIAAATTAIEHKTQRSGELAVKIVQGKNDLEDTIGALGEDEQFQVNLRKNCAEKEKDMSERTKTRAEESQAIAETIKVLNDDDALDLFKKTLPSQKRSFLQQTFSAVRTQQERARNIISEVAKTYKNTQFDFIALALKGKKVDFSKVIAMVDQMVKVLGEEQVDDNNHKAYCEKEFDTSEDKQGVTERRIESLTHEKEEADTASKNLAGEIKALQDGIAALDKSVVEATELRKSEHAEYVQTAAENQAALDLIAFAKNRLNKFYNPKLYNAPPARELSEEERVYSNFGGELEPIAPGGIAGTGVSAFLQLSSVGAPPPPPETFGAYSKKSSESGGVMAMIDMLSNDLKKDVQEAEHQEKDSQEDYEELMTDSQKKRAADSKSITTKEQAKAEADGVAQVSAENLSSANNELQVTKQYIANLHKDCDFLQENYDFRKTARAEEVDALKKAKSVLKGADYSLLQTRSSTFLKARETPCITMCRELNQYPKCQCPDFTYDATPGRMTFDELFAKFDQLIANGRQMLKDARANK
eukprot:GEMP01013279.1.p1 GENE.GEMP01013279.1~~GEMP01013279.1.p1  ORF type:complete len:765 (+),score=275.96 GEMP01013279.1:73-2367(+)